MSDPPHKMGLTLTADGPEPGETKGAVVETGKERRDLRLDAFRGLALWFIFIDHIPDNSLAWLTLRNYGFSDTSEVFVFVSGYTCMLAYGGSLSEQGWATTTVRALRRAWEIYAAFLVLLLAYAALVWVMGGGTRFIDETNTGFFFREPGPTLVHVALLQFAPVNTDILLTFAILHICFPVVLWLMMSSGMLTLALSFLLYMMVQLFSWHVPAWPSGELYFNPFAWQFLFVIGGWYAHVGTASLRRILNSRALLIAALAYLAFSLVVALSWEFKSLEGLIPSTVTGLIYPIYKSHLAPVRLLHFLSLAFVVSRLAPLEWRGPIKPLMTAMIRCGENSLPIYCIGVLLAFVGEVVLTDVSSGFAMQVLISVAGIAIMIAAATLLTWESLLDRRGPRLF
ncbi:OpgC domain-containing protein [Bradyrhizobium ontarionense]|uniref:OpgC domain-containing protein n=1 Tax=Bradyrhizobium ontarionense TaxID=2898149 RepID=A0ABY3RA78_9BRAD|nr:OpgC domain-containing protein [Bradyrhizobium sp. A19]UFZ04284.1 OpgC domain-containing protein [Bradyrhizobium sp. A19]